MHYTAIKYLVLWNYFRKKTNNKRKLLLLFAAFQTELRRPVYSFNNLMCNCSLVHTVNQYHSVNVFNEGNKQNGVF